MFSFSSVETSSGQQPQQHTRKAQSRGAVTTFSSLNLRAMTDPRTRTYSPGALTPLRGSQALTHRSAPVKGGLRRGSAWLNPPGTPQGRGPWHTAPRGRGGRSGRREGGPPARGGGTGGRSAATGGRLRRPQRVPAPPPSPVGHLGKLRPLEIGRQAPDLLPGGRHRRLAATRQPRRAGYGQRAGTNLLAAPAVRSAACRAGAAPAPQVLAAAAVVREKKREKGKKAVSPRGLTPAAGAQRT